MPTIIKRIIANQLKLEHKVLVFYYCFLYKIHFIAVRKTKRIIVPLKFLLLHIHEKHQRIRRSKNW